MNKLEIRKQPQVLQPTPEEPQEKPQTESELSKKIARMRDYDAELINGVFRNRENPRSSTQTGVLAFRYKMYPGDSFDAYELQDGERYRLPRGVVRWLNNGCFKREYVDIAGQNPASSTPVKAGYADGRLRAKEKMQASRKVHRYEFVPLDFIDDDADIRQGPTLVEISNSP